MAGTRASTLRCDRRAELRALGCEVGAFASRSHLLVFGLLAGLGVTGQGCAQSYDVSPAGQINIVVSETPTSATAPAPIAFEVAAARPGETLTIPIELTNSAENGVLTIDPLVLEASPGSEGVFRLDAPTTAVSLRHAEKLEAVISYTRPVGDSHPTAHLHIHSDTLDERERNVTIAVGVNDAFPVAIVPATLDFGLVRPGSTRGRTLVIRNTGQVSLRIFSAVPEAGAPFHLAAGGSALIGTTIKPQSSGALAVDFTPTSLEPVTASLVITTNEAGATAAHPVTLTGNVNVPAIQVAPVSFGTVFGNRQSVMTVHSTGAQPLEITGIRIGASSDPAFSLTFAGAPPSEDSPWTLAAGASSDDVEVHVNTSLAGVTSLQGVVEIESSAMEPLTKVDLSATAAASACPQSVIVVTPDAHSVAPGSKVTLSGKSSFAVQEGVTITEYHWSITTPDGQPLPDIPALDQDTLTATLWASGTYRFQLSVRDSAGQDACVEAARDVVVEPPDRLWVELSWTAQDSAMNVVAVDLDLHLADLTGITDGLPWFCPDRDCFWNSKNIDWGSHGYPADDPSLVQGVMPDPNRETVRILSPADGEYAVGVNWTKPLVPLPGDTVVHIKVRVLNHADLVGAFETDMPLTGEYSDLWDAAHITVTAAEIQVTPSDPSPFVDGSQTCGTY